jgi:hypothetical protein
VQAASPLVAKRSTVVGLATGHGTSLALVGAYVLAEELARPGLDSASGTAEAPTKLAR